MRFLDLDLDFFLDRVATGKGDSCRLDDDEYCPWQEDEVRGFLEGNCGLIKLSPVRGRIVEHHDEAFDFWNELIAEKQLTAPFDLVHVDAHADLGFGDNSFIYLMSEYLHIEPSKRNLVGRSEIRCGNFLLFAIACRWLSSLTYVRHPYWVGRNKLDLSCFHFKRGDLASGLIQLRKLPKDAFIDRASIHAIENLPVLDYEPEVLFKTVSGAEFRETNFDLILLSRSPGFTPRSSDELVDVFAEYIKQI